MKNKLKKAMLIGAGLSAAYLAIGNYFFYTALKKESDKGFILGQENSDLEPDIKEEWFFINKKRVNITSSTNVNLVGFEIINDIKKPWIVVIHGYASKSSDMSGYAKKFFDMGFNILMPDLIAHGQSEGDVISMGGADAVDLAKWVKYISEKYDNPEIVLFGVSMGAATVINSLDKNLPLNVKAFIEDSGYIDLNSQFKQQIEKLYHIPSFLILPAGIFMTKLRGKFDIKSINAKKALEQNKIPGLILHGDMDSFVPLENANEIYNALNCEKEIYISEGCSHIEGMNRDMFNYWEKVENFLKKHVNLI